jgi:transposase-like protein
VRCPYCGEENEIALDPDSGEAQEYVEDCQVCCRPWTVHVHYDVEGRAEVHVTSQDE